MEQEKKLSYNIERGTHNVLSWTNNYTYKFRNPQYLEQIDDFSYFGIDHNSYKQMHIDAMVNEFRLALNNVVFGDPAGKEYVEALENGEI